MPSAQNKCFGRFCLTLSKLLDTGYKHFADVIEVQCVNACFLLRVSGICWQFFWHCSSGSHSLPYTWMTVWFFTHVTAPKLTESSCQPNRIYCHSLFVFINIHKHVCISMLLLCCWEHFCGFFHQEPVWPHHFDLSSSLPMVPCCSAKNSFALAGLPAST